MLRLRAGTVAVGLLWFAAACQSSGAGGREVRITQRDDGCSPVRVNVTAGEKLKLVVSNESKQDFEIEGIDGTKLEELIVPEGRTRTPGYTVPGGQGTHKIKCYTPGGPATIIELIAGDASGVAPVASASASESPQTAQASAGSPSASATVADGGGADASVAVTLIEYSVTADKPSVAAGKVRFIATNASKNQVHELAVLKTKDDGTFDNMGEIEDIAAGDGGTVVLDLKPGVYQLACLIASGEAGSAVDHYQQGMHLALTVT